MLIHFIIPVFPQHWPGIVSKLAFIALLNRITVIQHKSTVQKFHAISILFVKLSTKKR